MERQAYDGGKNGGSIAAKSLTTGSETPSAPLSEVFGLAPEWLYSDKANCSQNSNNRKIFAALIEYNYGFKDAGGEDGETTGWQEYRSSEAYRNLSNKQLKQELIDLARNICRSCEIQPQCLEWGLRYADMDRAIYGGLTARERQAEVSRRKSEGESLPPKARPVRIRGSLRQQKAS